MRRLSAALAVVLAALAAAPTRVLADPSVDVVPPMAGPFHRTADTRPVFGIEAHAASPGDRLECYPESSADAARPCGPPLSGCSAELCASYQPDAPLTPGEHDFSVDLLDPSGASRIFPPAGLEFIVDTTPPPRPRFNGPYGKSPLRPRFLYGMRPDGPASYSVRDQAQCSLTRLGRPAAWRPCPSPAEGTGKPYVPARLARHSRDYRFQVRGVDDFGRTGRPAVADFNPIPCSVRARRVNVHRLLAHGLPVRVRCSLTRAAVVVLDDRRLGVLGLGVVHRRAAQRQWARRSAVRVDPLAVSYVKPAHRLRLAVTVVAGDDPGEPAYGQPRTVRLTIRG